MEVEVTMKNRRIVSIVGFTTFALLVVGCSSGDKANEQSAETTMENPFLTEWNNPFGAPPFDQIVPAHYIPAYEAGMTDHSAEIEAIVSNPEPATFENTIEVLERSGELLNRVSLYVGNQNGAHTNEETQAVVKEMSPRITAHFTDIALNAGLFERVAAVWEQKDELDLDPEQAMLLKQSYEGFVRNGGKLEGDDKDRMRAINEELTNLSVEFSENQLAEMSPPSLVIEDEADLVGLPHDVIAAAAGVATANELEGKWAFNLQRTSWTPFVTFSDRRDLREQLYTAYTNLGSNNNEYDNQEIASRIGALRVERANLLGYDTHADYVLEQRMAETPDRVFELLERVWTPALAKAKEEAAVLQAMIDKEGGDFELGPWDWWYYAEKVRAEKYEFDASSIKPYFELQNVLAGTLDVATRLFGITFEERADLPVYQQDVKVFEVNDADGSHLGILYTDYFTRASKRGGAWMNTYREQYRVDGEDIRPLVANHANFSKPVGDDPALLTLDEVGTLFHEFGHALHGLLANSTYESLSGTNVYWDYVEMPSQMLENWAMHPEVLPTYAKHYESGEPIPQELIDKLEASGKFNQGFVTTEYVAASLLDMNWHTLTAADQKDALEFEAEVMNEIGMIPTIVTRYRTPYFSHIFAGGYSSGYYSYMWAEVLDADAFEYFEEKGIFDPELARSYRENLLEPGGSVHPMELYLRFRGQEPSVEPLLERRGLL
jgi:peptidyl-dipeptidase Dcp